MRRPHADSTGTTQCSADALSKETARQDKDTLRHNADSADTAQNSAHILCKEREEQEEAEMAQHSADEVQTQCRRVADRMQRWHRHRK